MGLLEDLKTLGINIDDPIAVAKQIQSMAMTSDEKRIIFQSYLNQTGKTLSPGILEAAPFMR